MEKQVIINFCSKSYAPVVILCLSLWKKILNKKSFCFFLKKKNPPIYQMTLVIGVRKRFAFLSFFFLI